MEASPVTRSGTPSLPWLEPRAQSPTELTPTSKTHTVTVLGSVNLHIPPTLAGPEELLWPNLLVLRSTHCDLEGAEGGISQGHPLEGCRSQTPASQTENKAVALSRGHRASCGWSRPVVGRGRMETGALSSLVKGLSSQAHEREHS